MMQAASYVLAQGVDAPSGIEEVSSKTDIPTDVPPEKVKDKADKLVEKLDDGVKEAEAQLDGIEGKGDQTQLKDGGEKLENDEKGKVKKEDIKEGIEKEKSEEFPSIAKMGETLGKDIVSDLTDKYGEEKLEAIAEMYQSILDEGGEVPKTLEDFNEMIADRIAQLEKEGLHEDADEATHERENEGGSDEEGPTDDGVLAQVARQVLSGASAGQLRGYSSGGRNIPGNAPRLSPGNAEANRGQLDAAIREAPTEKARILLETASRFLGKNETTHRAELRSFLGFDPKTTPWCKGFTNACARESGISLNSSGSLFSLSGVNDGRPVQGNEKPLPGDQVMVRRNGGGHIGLFLGMSSNGNPIIIGGNQGPEGGGMVSIKEERRELVGITRIGGERDERRNPLIG